MRNKTTLIALMLGLTTALAGWAQPSDSAVFPGDGPREPGRWHAQRMERMVEYLELSESQTLEWQAILDAHRTAAPDRQQTEEMVEAWQEEFRTLADQAEPDLERLGQLALDIHRSRESRSLSRERLFTELRSVLTPEQSDKLDALQAARELSHPRRDGRGPRQHRGAPDSN